MEIIVSALDIEVKLLKEKLKSPVKFIKCGVKAKKLDFLKEVTPNDHLINFGICAGKNIGDLYLCNKIIGEDIYYPDIVNNSNIATSSITTINQLADKKLVRNNPNMLYDQESWLICKQARHYISPHQISILKIVSDNGNADITNIKSNINNLIKANLCKIQSYIENTRKLFLKINNNAPKKNYSKIISTLKCSESMKNQLYQLINYAECIGIDPFKYFDNLYKIQKIPPKNKKESIRAIEDFKNFLILETKLEN